MAGKQNSKIKEADSSPALNEQINDLQWTLDRVSDGVSNVAAEIHEISNEMLRLVHLLETKGLK